MSMQPSVQRLALAAAQAALWLAPGAAGSQRQLAVVQSAKQLQAALLGPAQHIHIVAHINVADDGLQEAVVDTYAERSGVENPAALQRSPSGDDGDDLGGTPSHAIGSRDASDARVASVGARIGPGAGSGTREGGALLQSITVYTCHCFELRAGAHMYAQAAQTLT